MRAPKEMGPSQKRNPEDEGRSEFPRVKVTPPEGAVTSRASKSLRKDFFIKARRAGYTDVKIREWMEKTWNIHSSAKLLTWQVEAMMTAIFNGPKD